MRKRIHNWLLKHLFNAVTIDDALSYDKRTGKMWIGKRELSTPNIASLKSEAKTMKQLQLYGLITTQIEYLANNKLYMRNSKPWDLVHPQAILQANDTFKLIVNEIANLELPEPPKPKVETKKEEPKKEEQRIPKVPKQPEKSGDNN